MNGNYEEYENDKKSHIKMELHSMQNTYNHKKILNELYNCHNPL